MQALQKKQNEAKLLRDLLKNNPNKTIEQRVDYAKHLQYVENEQLFATMYSTIFKAASDDSVLGLKHFLKTANSNNEKSKKIHKIKVDDFSPTGYCAIHYAAEKGANNAIKYLLEQGSDINIRTTYGNTALMQACKENQLESIALLIKLGADIKLFNRAGIGAIHLAAQGYRNHIQAIQLIVALLSNTTTAQQEEDDLSLIKERDDEEAEDLLSITSLQAYNSKHIDNIEVHHILNHASTNNTTPLHIACLSNSIETVEYLIQCKVMLDYKDNSNDTALHKAARKGLSHIYNLLSQAGASITVKNNFGETPADILADNITSY